MFSGDEAIFLLKGSGDLEKVPFQRYDSEALLQSLIEKHPELLAGDQINPDEPVRFMLVKREAGVPDGMPQGTLAISIGLDYALRRPEHAALVLTTVLVGAFASDLISDRALGTLLADAGETGKLAETPQPPVVAAAEGGNTP